MVGEPTCWDVAPNYSVVKATAEQPAHLRTVEGYRTAKLFDKVGTTCSKFTDLSGVWSLGAQVPLDSLVSGQEDTQ